MSLVPLDELVLQHEPGEGENEGTWTLCIPSKLRLLEGHFPNNPVLPGIGQMMIIRKLLERTLGRPLSLQEIERSRITAPLLPGETCQIALKWTPHETHRWRVVINVQKDKTRCARMVAWFQSIGT